MPLPDFIGIPLSLLAVLALTAWLSIIMLAPLWFYPYLKKNSPIDILTFSLLFIVGEWLSEYVPILSFPWSGLWMGLTNEPILIQSASLLGCHFTSLIILLSSGAITLVLCNYKNKKSIGYSLIFAALTAVNISYGITHIYDIKKDLNTADKTKIMIAQDNVEGREKNKLRANDAINSYISIMEQNWQEGIDFVVLPETAIPCDYEQGAEAFKPLIEFAKKHNTTLLTGCFVEKDGETYNAMYTVTEKGFCKTPYLKQVLVPFGEKIPLAKLFGAETLSPAEPGLNKELLCEDNNKIASVICIESIYPSLVREQISKGGEILCVSTNDSWFGKSYAKYAHYRHTIMRAVESGKYTLRAGNCGISAVITPWGEQISVISDSSKASIVSEINSISSKTLYTYTGDIIILPGCIMILICIIKILKRKLIKK